MSNLEELHRRLRPVATGNLEREISKATLRFTGVLHPREGFQLRVFVNAPEATAATDPTESPGYAGTQYFYGQGKTPERFAAVREDRPGFGHRFDLEMDITKAVQGVVDDADEVEVSLVALDFHGNPVSLDELKLEGFSLEIE